MCGRGELLSSVPACINWCVVSNIQCAMCTSVQCCGLVAVSSVVVQGPEGETRPGAIPRGGNIEAPPPHKGGEEEDDGGANG